VTPRQIARFGLLATALVVVASCGDGGKSGAKGGSGATLDDAAFVRRFHAGVVELEQHRFLDASTTFEALTRERPKNLGAWINLAQAELNRNTPEAHAKVHAACAGALAVDPNNPHAHFIAGILFKHLGEFDKAEAAFREAMKGAPDDPTLLYQLASSLPPERSDEALTFLSRCLEGQSHLSSAYYKLAEIKGRDDVETKMKVLETFTAFEAAETGALAGIVYTEMGRLGEAYRDAGVALPPPPLTPSPIAFEEPKPIAAISPALVVSENGVALIGDAPKAAQRVAVDLDQDGKPEVATLRDGALVVSPKTSTAAKEPMASVSDAAAFTMADVDQDADLDVVVARRNGAVDFLLQLRDENWTLAAYDPESRLGGRVRGVPPKLPSAAAAVAACDLDADGDPDLLFAGPFGLRFFRNDRLMRFVDATERAGLSGLPPCRAFLAEDLDGDRAIDLVALADDGTPFVFRQVVRGRFTGTFAPVKGALEPFAPIRSLRVADFDLDGEDDVVFATADRVIAAPRGAARVARGERLESRVELSIANVAATMVADFDGNGAPDLALVGDDGATKVAHVKKPEGRRALSIRLLGRTEPKKMRSNPGGVGARVEVTAGARSIVREASVFSGMPGQTSPILHFGLGAVGTADYVRVTWPDDVVQIEGAVPANDGAAPKEIEETQRKASSCPLIFAWDGEAYAFVTDFLGVGGLGFALAPGVYADPDPTERVLLPTLAPKDGAYELIVHEPFEEACYLDLAKLVVVDHPEDVEILPDERFAVGAPPPDGRLFAIRKRLLPRAAVDGRGRDVTTAVRSLDRKEAAAEPHPNFLGYAEPTTFTFDFGGDLRALADAGPIVLALDAWVEYPYSHIVAAAWQLDLKLKPISVDAEVEGGAFVVLMEDAAYPAGMPRAMTLPLPTLPPKATGRLRLRTNQELHIDRASVFAPDDAATTVRTLEATRATLRPTGYPREYSPDGAMPRLYDYGILDKSLQFKTLAGSYTRFGEVAELLSSADDRYVVFSGGEEVALRFEALPPPEKGLTRTFILDAVGWCKDMDPHTAAPHTLEPLPFLGMPGYPYPPTVRFPDSPAHRDWIDRFQTRRVPGTRAAR
jgi:tetratricopeptide (TPR) repeat protein